MTAAPAHAPHDHRPALIGARLSVLSLPLHGVLPFQASVQLSALLVAGIAAIYVGFALSGGRARAMVTECLVATGFVGVALLGLWRAPLVIPALYVAHAAWDALHYRPAASLAAPPRWYPPFCAVYDLVFAVGLLAVWMLRDGLSLSALAGNGLAGL